MIWVQLFLKLTAFDEKESHDSIRRVVTKVTLCVVTQGLLATYFAVVHDIGGLCVDTLGVGSPAAIWGEWIGTGYVIMISMSRTFPLLNILTNQFVYT